MHIEILRTVQEPLTLTSYITFNLDLVFNPETIYFIMQVKISPIVTFDWEVKLYKGQQVAVDKNHHYVAYAIKGNLYSRFALFIKLITLSTAQPIKC